MKQDKEPTMIERAVTLALPPSLVWKLLFEAVGAPSDATITSDVRGDYGSEDYGRMPGARITYSTIDTLKPEEKTNAR